MQRYKSSSPSGATCVLMQFLTDCPIVSRISNDKMSTRPSSLVHRCSRAREPNLLHMQIWRHRSIDYKTLQFSMDSNPSYFSGQLGRVDIYVKLSVIVGARSPRPLTNAGWNPQTIRVELIVGRNSYLGTETSILENRPTAVRNHL